MNVKAASNLINTSPDSVRRWCSEYEDFLSKSAAPPAGIERELTEHDLRIMAYISAARKAKTPHEAIRANLDSLQLAGWDGLPEIPEEWVDRSRDGLISMSEAGERSQILAEYAVLQSQHQSLRVQYDDAQSRAIDLRRQLDDALSNQRTSDSEITSLRVQLADTQGEVKSLRAQLASYSLRGDKPVPLFLLIVTVFLVSVLMILLVFAVAFGLASL